jgi:hypothetical protein
MVSKKKVSKNNDLEDDESGQNETIENNDITEEEKQMLQHYYNQQQQTKEPEVKPKRQISDAQRESLARAREMALLKKKELKDITEKKKIIQHMKKEEKKLDVEKEYKETVERVGNKKEEKQPEIKERKIKKIIYEDEEDDNKSFSYSSFTKKSAMEQMKDKINEDRLKFLYQKYILR